MKTYREKLLDPRWQEKRLRVMERAGFACEECGAKTQTLHVHHKQYKRGREPWEYENSELECLCENCHKTHHEHTTAINQQISQCDRFELPRVHALLVGFLGGIAFPHGAAPEIEKFATDKLFPGEECGHAYVAGLMASEFSDLKIEQVEMVLDLFRAEGPDGFMEIIRRAIPGGA